MINIFTVIQLSIVMQLACGVLSEECINTPESYKDVFENVVETGVEFSCIGRQLMGSIAGPFSYEGGDCPLNENTKPDSIR